jgi:hypothetical protein
MTIADDDDLGRDLGAFLDERRACGTLATGFTGRARAHVAGVLVRGAD